MSLDEASRIGTLWVPHQDVNNSHLLSYTLADWVVIDLRTKAVEAAERP